MPKIWDLDDVTRLMGGVKLTASQARWYKLPKGYTRYYIVNAPAVDYFYGMLENCDCHLVKRIPKITR